MKIGRMYANTTLEENRGNRDIIAMGVITGEGLLGVVAEAVVELARASEDCGYRHVGWPHLKAEKREEQAWLALFDALKALEAESEKTAARIEDAGYAMVGGNELDEPVPVDVVSKWLAYIEDGRDSVGQHSFPEDDPNSRCVYCKRTWEEVLSGGIPCPLYCTQGM